MFVSDGYVCASQPTATLRVTDARDVGNLCMLVTFNTGETRLLDATELTKFEAFAPLGNQKTFSSFSIDHGVLQWLDGEIDIAPEGLYLRSFEYPAEMIAQARHRAISRRPSSLSFDYALRGLGHDVAQEAVAFGF